MSDVTELLTLRITLPDDTWQKIEEMAYAIDHEPGRQLPSLGMATRRTAQAWLRGARRTGRR